MNIHSLFRCILINVLFLTVNPIFADTPSNEAYLKLTDEMRNIVDCNKKNFDSMRCIHGIIKTITTYPYPSSNEKEYRVMEQTDEFWYDGNHSRTDTLEGKFIGKETDPLRIVHEETGGTLIIKPKATGHTEIESIESSIYYEATYPTVFIEPSTEKAGRFYKKIRFMYYQTIEGDTLKEDALYLAERDQYFTVKNETVDGDDCLLLEHYNADNDLTRKIWVVPSKGYCIKKLQLIQMGKLRYGYETTLKEYLPGIWGLDSAKVIMWGEPGKKIEISVKSLTLNESIDPKTFTLAGTNIPIGTRIRDDISGLRYVFGEDELNPLKDKPLPDMKQFAVAGDPNQTKDKMILVCFFDMNQRPSRNCLLQLSSRTKELEAKDIAIVGVQVSNIDENDLRKWTKENNISFPVGMVQGDEDKIRFSWGVRSLPWLILTDTKHIVTTEGFSVAELDDKLEGNSH